MRLGSLWPPRTCAVLCAPSSPSFGVRVLFSLGRLQLRLSQRFHIFYSLFSSRSSESAVVFMYVSFSRIFSHSCLFILMALYGPQGQALYIVVMAACSSVIGSTTPVSMLRPAA